MISKPSKRSIAELLQHDHIVLRDERHATQACPYVRRSCSALVGWDAAAKNWTDKDPCQPSPAYGIYLIHHS